jgi:hypothetical protein
MAFFKDRSDVSKDNILKPALESLSVDEQQQFQDYVKKVQEEAKEKYLSHFTVDRHQKIVKQGEIEMASLLPLAQNPNVSKSNCI